jgi:adenosylmethionine-8-amino-7-oxononanoate aminotransferase
VTSILHRSLTARLPVAVRGEGLRLHLDDGRVILDASGGAAVACLGHGNARVAAAIGAQAARMAYAHTGFFTSEPAEALAEMLVGHRPGGLTHAFFVSSGSEAVESALKLARQYHVERGEPQRVHYLSRRQSYHGASYGSLGVSGNMGRRRPYEDILPPNMFRVSACFPYHGQAPGEEDAAYVARLAAELDAEILRVGPDRVIAFLAETVVGATAGCVAAVPGYFPAIRRVCDRYGVLLVLDEIMCGMGRTGTVHAWEQEGVVPDIQVIAKGMGGGYVPIGGLLVSGRVIEGLSTGSGMFVHGHTYQAHPVSCAGALEVQRIIAEEALVARAAASGTYLRERLKGALGDHPNVGDIRGRGLFLAVEFVEDRSTRRPFPVTARVHERVKAEALAAGVAVYPTGGTVDGVVGDHALIAPPYNVTEGEIDEVVERLTVAVSRVFASS